MGPSIVAVGVLLGLVALRWVLVGVGMAMIIRPVDDCPACFRPTVGVRRGILRPLSRWYEWRWCPHCSWQGMSRRSPPTTGSPWT